MGSMITRKRRSDGEQSRANILETALGLFRERGFEKTTMRDIASASGLSLGAAYHYFPSKEALVLAYYHRVQERHEEEARLALAGLSELSLRLRAVMSTKLELLQGDQRLLRAILQTMLGADPSLSVFSAETRDVRHQSLAIFEEALVCEEVPEEARPLFSRALWMLHLGMLLYFVNDTSAGQEKTRQFVNGSVELIAKMAPILGSPVLGPMREEIMCLMLDAGLMGRAEEAQRSE
jgi:AcrR family transcriptional regulator